MTHWRHNSFWLAWLLCLPLVLLSWLPAGTMLTLSETGSFQVVLCTGEGPVEVSLNAEGEVIEDESPADTAHAPCDFAALSVDRALAPAQALALFQPSEQLFTPSIHIALGRLKANVLAPSARGPPLTV